MAMLRKHTPTPSVCLQGPSICLQGHRHQPRARSHPFPPGPSEQLTSVSFSIATHTSFPSKHKWVLHSSWAVLFDLCTRCLPWVRGELCQTLPTQHRAPAHRGSAGPPESIACLRCLQNESHREPLLTDSDWLDSSWGCNDPTTNNNSDDLSGMMYLQTHGASL